MPLYRCGNNGKNVIVSHYNYETSSGSISIQLEANQSYYIFAMGKGQRQDGAENLISISSSGTPLNLTEIITVGGTVEVGNFYSNTPYTPTTDVTITVNHIGVGGLEEAIVGAIHVDHLG